MQTVGKALPGALKAIIWFLLFLGVFLLIIDLYGAFQEIRRPRLGMDDHENLRFVPEEVWSYEKSLSEIAGLESLKTPDEIAYKANDVIHHSMVHVEWPRVDPVEYRQMVPVWENYFLHAIGRLTELPQFERYHFSDYERSIERGIGICGDFSMVLSQVLERFGIDSNIVSFDGHVVVEYVTETGRHQILDPDFGVILQVGPDELKTQPEMVKSSYLRAGYSPAEIDYLLNIYSTRYVLFDDTYDFMSKRYVFERISYLLKWLLPVLLVVLSVALLLTKRERKVHSSHRDVFK